jgi:HAD superfamily hydrolase (TIGR01484 family)
MYSNNSLLLATDLDGTFLEGSERERTSFYQYVQANRDHILLVFVTGREISRIRSLYTDPNFPKPDYVIADVGTTIVHGKTFEPITVIQDWVAQKWKNANQRVKDLLANESGIELQLVKTERYVSYCYQPALLQPSTLAKITAAGFDYILSADTFLDVMPRGVAKGATLLKLIEAMRLDPNSAIVCGDTLNDLSLFETGLKGIAVKNSEPKLIRKTQTMENVYHSPYCGVMGIWDGLNVYIKQAALTDAQ